MLNAGALERPSAQRHVCFHEPRKKRLPQKCPTKHLTTRRLPTPTKKRRSWRRISQRCGPIIDRATAQYTTLDGEVSDRVVALGNVQLEIDTVRADEREIFLKAKGDLEKGICRSAGSTDDLERSQCRSRRQY